MARPLRIEFEGAVYHITSRGNAGQAIFLDDGDRLQLLDVILEVVERFGWVCHAYCLMSNHYHLLIETPRANLSRGMRHLNGVYTQSFNKRHTRAGHIFQGRFKAILVEKENHLLEVARYIVLNPVCAQMTKHPGQWAWSSYQATVGEIASPAFLSAGWLLEQFDQQPKRARVTYQRFVDAGVGISLWDDLRGGVLLGGEQFAEQMRPFLHAAARSKEIPRLERMLAKPSFEELFQGTETDKALRNERIHIAVREHDYTLFQLQDYLGMHYSTISRIVKQFDEGRRSKNKT